MRVKYIIVSYLLLSSLPAVVLGISCPTDSPGIACCYTCEDGKWVLIDGSECDEHSDCPGVQKCFCTYDNGCKCECDDSEQKTQLIFYTPGGVTLIEKTLSDILDKGGVEINASVAVSAKMNKRDECCDEKDSEYTTHIWGSAGLEITVSASYDLLHVPDFNFVEEWKGAGRIKAASDIDLGPYADMKGSGSVDGDYVGCPKDAPCYMAEGSISGEIGLKAEGSVELTLETETGWSWFDGLFTFSVNGSASGSASVGASAEVEYYENSATNCQYDKSGLQIGCAEIGKIRLIVAVSFSVGSLGPYSVSDEKIIFDGWNNGKCD